MVDARNCETQQVLVFDTRAAPLDVSDRGREVARCCGDRVGHDQ